LKIGIIAWPVDDDKKTGISFYIQNVVEQLVALGHSDDLLLVRAKQNVKYAKEEIIVPTARNKIGRGLERLFTLPYELNKREVDVVYFPYYYPMLAGAVAFTKKKKVLTIHDLVPLLYPQTQPSKIEARLWAATMKRFIRSFSKLTTVSEHTKQDVVVHFGIPAEMIDVIYPGCNPAFRRISDEAERVLLSQLLRDHFGLDFPFILFVGTLEPRKNVQRILQAFAILKSQGYPHKLVLVGKKGWKYEPVFRTISELHLTEDVIWTGYAKIEEMVALYNFADVFVFPSLYEGFGSPPLEAMACGTPVVTSNISSLPEVVGDAALLASPENVEEIANAMVSIIEDTELKKKLAFKGLERAKQFTWEKTAEKTWSLLQSIL